MGIYETKGPLNPVEHRAILVPRPECALMLRYLRKGEHIALQNPRQTGKTTLLYVESGQEVATLRGHWVSVLSVSFSPDGKLLASGSLPNPVPQRSLQSHRNI